MRTESAGVRPVSVRGLLFLLGFVSFLALSLIGPHVHGADVAPSPVSLTAVAVSSLGDAPTPAHAAQSGERDGVAASQPSEQALGVAAACVLVLLVTLAWLATRRAPELAPARQSETPLPRILHGVTGGPSLPLFRLLSISRT
ncbi:MAG: hypothetical protein KA158_12020 [Leucobacter sp.]|nr:hypothetical protein [Leucobacter sp.]